MFVSLYALTHIVILCSLNIFIAFYSIYLVFRFYCVLTICLCHIKKTYLICCLHFSLYSQSRIGKACSIPTRIEQYTATTTTTTTEHTTQSPIVLTTDLFFSLSLRMSFHGFSSHTYHCHTVAVSVCVLSFWAVYVAVTNHIQSETTGRGENLICHMATECADWLSHLNQWHFRDLSWQFLWHCLVTFMLLVQHRNTFWIARIFAAFVCTEVVIVGIVRLFTVFRTQFVWNNLLNCWKWTHTQCVCHGVYLIY